MFRKMRLFKKEISRNDAIKIIEAAEHGTLAVLGADDYPYAVPLNYVYYKDCIYFHCALNGHKIDSIKGNNKVSFSIVGKSKVIPEKFTTEYESVTIFGKAHIITDKDAKQDALIALINKYSKDFFEDGLKEIDQFIIRTCIVKIEIEHLTGKKA